MTKEEKLFKEIMKRFIKEKLIDKELFFGDRVIVGFTTIKIKDIEFYEIGENNE